MYGADDFLPMLTYVLAQCDMPQLDTEIQYMMELLDPSLLQGEGISASIMSPLFKLQKENPTDLNRFESMMLKQLSSLLCL